MRIAITNILANGEQAKTTHRRPPKSPHILSSRLRRLNRPLEPSIAHQRCQILGRSLVLIVIITAICPGECQCEYYLKFDQWKEAASVGGRSCLHGFFSSPLLSPNLQEIG